MRVFMFYLLSYQIAVSSFLVPNAVVVQNRQRLTSLAAQKPGYGPAIPPFRFSDNVLCSKTPHPSYNNNADYSNNSNKNNDYINGYTPSNQPATLPSQKQSTSPPNNMMYSPPPTSSSSSYLDQLQQQRQQQQEVPPVQEQSSQQQQQSFVHNDFSEYERQLRQLTKGQ